MEVSRVARLRAPFNEEGEVEEEGDGRWEMGGHLLSRSMSGCAGKREPLSLNARGGNQPCPPARR